MKTTPCKAEDFLKKRLRDLREKTGLTQEAFAEQAQFSYKYYQGIERGQWTNLRLRTLQSLADGYGITLSALFDVKIPNPKIVAKPSLAPHYKKKVKNGTQIRALPKDLPTRRKRVKAENRMD